MTTLYTKLQQQVQQWRENGYLCLEYPELTEILKYNKIDEHNLRFLRFPQFEAIETYFYIRFVLKTPHTIELFKKLFDNNKEELFKSIGIKHINKDAIDDVDLESVLNKIKNNSIPDVIKKHKYETLQEALNLKYSSYILALAMGVGKTILIGSIVAIEFAIALQHSNDDLVMKNALIFAQGTTILDALREILDIPFEKIIPNRLHNELMPQMKINYIRDGDKSFSGVIENSYYNILITNTEKIILRNKNYSNDLFKQKEEENKLFENQRLYKIKSLNNLGIFSDEAHHTYGNNIDELKRVRETINRINENKKIICIVNTTGTPYYQREPLKEVIYWYGLENGIRDNILKSVENNIKVYSLENEKSEELAINDIVIDFFKNYKDVKLLNGAISKLAFYFKTQEHLEESKIIIEKALIDIKEDITTILVNTQKSSNKELEDFKNLNSPLSQKRIILLISKGTEGWNCPSLFATAIIKDSTNSNNFVLQASTRCLRQVKDNTIKAKIYLSDKNKEILNRELLDNYNISLNVIEKQDVKLEEIRASIRKQDIPKLEIVRTKDRIVRKENNNIKIKFKKIENVEENRLISVISNISDNKIYEIDTLEIIKDKTNIFLSIYNASSKIAKKYHLNVNDIFKSLKNFYSLEVPISHIEELFRQVESQTQDYEIIKEKIAEALAIIKMQDSNGNFVFEKDDKGNFYHTIRFVKGTLREKLIKHYSGEKFGFHIEAYDFDSNPEKSFFEKIINILEENPRDIMDIYFTGSISDIKKTDIHFEYKGKDGKFHNYFPDFVIAKKNGDFLIVEIKSTNKIDDLDTESKKKAVEYIENIPENKFKYVIVYTSNEVIENTNENYIKACGWINS